MYILFSFYGLHIEEMYFLVSVDYNDINHQEMYIIFVDFILFLKV